MYRGYRERAQRAAVRAKRAVRTYYFFEKILGELLVELLGLLAILHVGKERFPFDLKWLISGFFQKMALKNPGKYPEIRVFELKTDIWSAKPPQ